MDQVPSTQGQPSGVARVHNLLNSPAIKKRFDEVLGQKSAGFMSSIISAVASNNRLLECDPMSVISSAAVAASMDLPINQNLGFAHIVPYKGVAQFQIGWKGLVQLAMRTGQYKTINATKILEGQIKDLNPFTGEMEFQREAKSDKIVGYLLYFKLMNGFEKYFYMTAKECDDHAQRYSQSYKYDLREKKTTSKWSENFDAMALKTVVKMGLSKYGILSIQMEKAISVDQAEVTIDAEVVSYPDAIQEQLPAPAQAKPKGPSRVKEAIKTTAKPAPAASVPLAQEPPHEVGGAEEDVI